VSIVFLLYAALTTGLGFWRPGLLIALGMHGYNYESYFGGNQAIGVVMALIPFPFAVFRLATGTGLKFYVTDAVFLVFIGIYILAGLHAPVPKEAMIQLTKFFLFVVSYYFVIRCFVRNGDELRTVFKDFFISTLILVVLFGLVAESNEWGRFATVGVAHPVGWSVSLNAALAFLLGYLFLKRDWRLINNTLIDTVIVVVTLVAVAWFSYLNGKRGATLSPVIALAVVWFFAYVASARPQVRSLLIATAAMGVVAFPFVITGIAYVVDGMDFLGHHFKVPILVIADALGFWSAPVVYDPSSEERMEIYHHAWRMIFESPLIGNGLGSFEQNRLGHPHSIFLEMWIEGGIVMLVALLAFIGKILWDAFAFIAANQRPHIMGIVLTAALGCFVQMVTAMTIYHGKILWIGFGFIAAASIIRMQARAPVVPAPAVPAAPRGGWRPVSRTIER
jgi:O-antigen ligase